MCAWAWFCVRLCACVYVFVRVCVHAGVFLWSCECLCSMHTCACRVWVCKVNHDSDHLYWLLSSCNCTTAGVNVFTLHICTMVCTWSACTSAHWCARGRRAVKRSRRGMRATHGRCTAFRCRRSWSSHRCSSPTAGCRCPCWHRSPPGRWCWDLRGGGRLRGQLTSLVVWLVLNRSAPKVGIFNISLRL